MNRTSASHRRGPAARLALAAIAVALPLPLLTACGDKPAGKIEAPTLADRSTEELYSKRRDLLAEADYVKSEGVDPARQTAAIEQIDAELRKRGLDPLKPPAAVPSSGG